MSASLSRHFLAPVLALAVFTMCSPAFAQGTATGPITTHTVDPGPVVNIGDPTNPFPIDLDPTGQPWTKNLIDPVGIFIAGGTLDIVETSSMSGTSLGLIGTSTSLRTRLAFFRVPGRM